MKHKIRKQQTRNKLIQLQVTVSNARHKGRRHKARKEEEKAYKEEECARSINKASEDYQQQKKQVPSP
jgi:hypothetical protein